MRRASPAAESGAAASCSRMRRRGGASAAATRLASLSTLTAAVVSMRSRLPIDRKICQLVRPVRPADPVCPPPPERQAAATPPHDWRMRSTPTHAPAAPGDLPGVVGELRAARGVDARRLRAIGCQLADGQWHETGALVRRHATSRRTVEDLLTRLRPWLEQRADRFRVAAAHREAMAAAWGCAPAPTPPDGEIEAA